MPVYKSKYSQLPGSSYVEAFAAARREYRLIQKRTPRRQPYVRSRYFTKDKIFLNEFWKHLEQKTRLDKFRRIKLYLCALDLLRNITDTPETIFDNKNRNIMLHRFIGVTKDGERFCVQIKENKRSNRKDFMSVFPAKKLRK